MPANASLQGKASYFILLITLTAVATGFSAAAYDFIYIKNIILTLGIILLFSFSNWYKNQIVSKESLYPLVFIVWMGISAFTGKFAYKGIAEATVFFSVYMLFFFIANFQNLNIKKLRTFVVWASVPALMIGGLQIFIPQRFGGFMLFGERIPSFLGNPNFFGAYLTAMLPLIFFEAIEAKRLYRGLLLILFLLALVCIVRTGSKASLIGVIVEIPIVLFFLLKNKKHALYVTGIIVFVAALVGVYAVLQPEKIMQNESVFFRVHTWQSTLKIIATHPLNGTGPGTFALVYPKYRSEAIVKWASEHSYETTKPENILLQTMAETGLIGLGLFLFMLFSDYQPWPNQSPEPTGVTPFFLPRSRGLFHIVVRPWLSFFR